MQERVKTAIDKQNIRDIASLAKSAVQLREDNGYDFTAEEAQAAIEHVVGQRDAFADEQLEAVVGGGPAAPARPKPHVDMLKKKPHYD